MNNCVQCSGFFVNNCVKGVQGFELKTVLCQAVKRVVLCNFYHFLEDLITNVFILCIQMFPSIYDNVCP